MTEREVEQNMDWKLSFRADQKARVIADRHYNRQSVGAKQFVPPGRCLVLLSNDEDAFWISSFPYAEYTHHEWAGAWICTAFRNEGPLLSSVLIRQAIAATRFYWGCPPELGMITFVNPGKVRHKRDPGRCFIKAGFNLVGETKVNKLLAFQLLPENMPGPEMAINQQGVLF